MDQKTRICSGLWCYSETYNGYVETGCLDQRQPLLCENRLSSKLPQHRISHCCNDKDFCNKNVVPTPAPPRTIQGTSCLCLSIPPEETIWLYLTKARFVHIFTMNIRRYTFLYTVMHSNNCILFPFSNLIYFKFNLVTAMILHVCPFCIAVIEVDKPEDPKYDNAIPNDVLSNRNEDLKHDADHTDCPCALNGPNKDNSKMLNPIYIAVPVAGVCVLLALVIFAMYLLRRRTDYYERYNYPRNVTVPPCHMISGAKQSSSPCKINRCTDSERSSASSETRLFL